MSLFKRILSRRSAAMLSPQAIPHRSIRFTFDDSIPRYWHGGRTHTTRFFDCLSFMFPQGEKIFIESVVHFRHLLDRGSALDKAVDDFVYQEASHIREHRAYNLLLGTQGAPVEKLERMLLRRRKESERLPASFRLALTASLEHITAILSEQILRNPAFMAGADPTMARLWRWHAMEEIEHKAVAYDVLCKVERNPLRRYLLRWVAMTSLSVYFTFDLTYFTYHLVRGDRQHRNWREWLRLQWWLFVNPGLLSRIVPAGLFWFAPGFHPDRIDTRELLDNARQALDEQR
ncbi:metal-dependent hydrolase [Pseudomonas syringae]|jgi:predicted metal-dependent hydrolase|uniref:Metal-dependent hydrolase n=1 Tax=Pseudomonas syringae pv. syringae TaxID=321 RepID=A0AB35JIP9_PSESY|nr:metal-dependent hydrolase [Pseudomonas syringae]MBI6749309.1 metal-dependent hydrolase [Pseudomonas syringae]MBI6771298.1 metal-dependent hydrolase [Pseudomonas syringae]MBI6776609.1 metal-dependent hydrolase [Pseudomonas syringae]MBI6792718.1 metal-dependent hydrolase [Pseudomonas syringae]MBI6799970.1 metal-dependent hydrolase [Pseudomonas syringae]